MPSNTVGSSALLNAFNMVPLIVAVGASIVYTRWLWQQSRVVIEDRHIASLPERLRFIAVGWRHQELLWPMRTALPGSALGRATAPNSVMFDAVTRPYQSTAWNAATRLRKVSAHYETMAGLRLPIWPAAGEMLQIVRFDGILGGLRLVVDEACWLKREGPLVLSIFSGDHRLFSIAFALRREDGRLLAYVGAIQGCNQPGTLDIFRTLTHIAHGIRPQDLMVELFRMFCGDIGVERILLVSDSHRHHRDRYFGAKAEGFSTNYDTIWTTRGAIRIDAGTFELPITPRRRAADAIPPRKRGLYRRRYAMLDIAAAQMDAGIAALRTAETADDDRSIAR
ncbi:VirK/YbjX family protein [Sphingomonas sp. SUN019]|uniref:VirK/YbjX family protein n=1 Tax=Sphingomonas sp. SUN019 TaxID=2937788 RepID=UPI002164AD1D|nr:VirK/YbjX family protein [Sphingomonas sp. SUN019]UVO51491.1 VirK/YbjX family protein [Sphingomonas sp. SUN019]